MKVVNIMMFVSRVRYVFAVVLLLSILCMLVLNNVNTFVLHFLPTTYNSTFNSTFKRTARRRPVNTTGFTINNQSFIGFEGMEIDDGILPVAPNLAINDITFTITTSHNLVERWNNILLTWYSLVRDNVVWITDKKSSFSDELSGVEWLYTNCWSDHSIAALSCKLGAEFEVFMGSESKWWCHVDDDMYVNTDVLVRLLSKYNPDTDVYIGRNSHKGAMKRTWERSFVHVWYATGGGFCISRALAYKMDKYISRGKLVEWSLELGAADDGTIGFIINFLLHTKLTVTELIYTHLPIHGMTNLTSHEIPHQAMLSYDYKNNRSRVNITAADVRGKSKFFNIDEDPSRFFTIHCMIHPQVEICQ